MENANSTEAESFILQDQMAEPSLSSDSLDSFEPETGKSSGIVLPLSNRYMHKFQTLLHSPADPDSVEAEIRRLERHLEASTTNINVQLNSRMFAPIRRDSQDTAAQHARDTITQGNPE